MKTIHRFRWLILEEESKKDWDDSIVAVRCGRDVRRKFSRKSWKGVMCKACLRLKGIVDRPRLWREWYESHP